MPIGIALSTDVQVLDRGAQCGGHEDWRQRTLVQVNNEHHSCHQKVLRSCHYWSIRSIIVIYQCSMFYCSGKNSWSYRLLPFPKVGRRPLSGGSTFQVAAKPAWSPNVSEHIKYSQGYLQQHLPWFKSIYTYLQCNLIPVIQDKLNVIFTMKNIEYLYICVYTTKNINYLLYILCTRSLGALRAPTSRFGPFGPA